MSLFAAVGVFGAASVATMFEPWVAISLASWAALCGSSCAILLGYLVSVYAIRTGDVSFTAQFRYIGLIAALILGYVFFGEWPDRLALIGAAIIVGTGAFTLYRQRASRKVNPA